MNELKILATKLNFDISISGLDKIYFAKDNSVNRGVITITNMSDKIINARFVCSTGNIVENLVYTDIVNMIKDIDTVLSQSACVYSISFDEMNSTAGCSAVVGTINLKNDCYA